MILTALILTRNSDWCIGATLRAVLTWCDNAVVMMHRCTDRTSDIIANPHFGATVLALQDKAEEFEEMRLRQTMLEAAREIFHSTHIALVDDDEILTGNLAKDIRKVIEGMPAGEILTVPWLQLRGVVGDGFSQYMTSGLWSRQMVSLAFKDEPAFCWESASRGGYDFHHRHPCGKDYVPCVPWSNFRRWGLDAPSVRLKTAADRKAVSIPALGDEAVAELFSSSSRGKVYPYGR